MIKFWKVKVKGQGRWGGMHSTERPSSCYWHYLFFFSYNNFTCCFVLQAERWGTVNYRAASTMNALVINCITCFDAIVETVLQSFICNSQLRTKQPFTEYGWVTFSSCRDRLMTCKFVNFNEFLKFPKWCCTAARATVTVQSRQISCSPFILFVKI